VKWQCALAAWMDEEPDLEFAVPLTESCWPASAMRRPCRRSSSSCANSTAVETPCGAWKSASDCGEPA
jgi:hypothetical protein